MAKYLLLKHYNSTTKSLDCAPMSEWTPEEVDNHIQFMRDFAAKLEGTGEFVAAEAVSTDTNQAAEQIRAASSSARMLSAPRLRAAAWRRARWRLLPCSPRPSRHSTRGARR